MKPLTRLTQFVIEQAATQPLALRAALYRDLAAISGTAAQADALTRMAEDLEAIEARHHQLLLNFRARTT